MRKRIREGEGEDATETNMWRAGGGEDECQAKQESKIPGPEAVFPVPPGNLGLLPTARFFLQAVSPIPETTRGCSDGGADPDPP